VKLHNLITVVLHFINDILDLIPRVILDSK